MTTITYKQSPPRRPTIGDLDGGQLVDDPEFPPDPGDPSAGAANQRDMLLVAQQGMAEHTKLYITFSGGTPTKTGIRSLRDDLTTADFTVTDNGAGDTSITHTGGKLPADAWPAESKVVGNSGDATDNVELITNGWRVRTRVGGTLADVPFVLKIFGA